MTTPVHELPQPQFGSHQDPALNTRSPDSDDEGTLSNEQEKLEKSNISDGLSYLGGIRSQSRSQDDENRLDDDLAMLHAERAVSEQQNDTEVDLRKSMSMHRSRSRPEPVDQFDVNTNPIHEMAASFSPPENPAGNMAKAFRKINDASFLIRYICYIIPLVMIILIPLMLGALVFTKATVGGVRLMWFCVWLEVVWLTLWGGRIVAKALPWPVGLVSSLFTNNSKKWRDMCKQLELPATLFFWWLAVLISFLPIMINNHLDGDKSTRNWEVSLNKVLISFFVGAIMNFVEKIIIQLIAISFHLRTYADRIEVNKFQIGSLTKLYQYSKEKITLEDSEFADRTPAGPGSGARTPMQLLDEAQKKTQTIFGKVGDAAGKVAGDFTGKKVTKSTHPRQLVLLLLSSPSQSQVLARRLYRTFDKEGAETISAEDLKHAFDNDDEADSAFAMFDKDMNGDISMSELEAVCVDIGKERKSITASLKDLDSVVAKLDAVLLFFVIVATILVLLSLISTSAAGVLTSAGSAVLALSWLFSTTAQEFLASCIFVLVKHPFDVGDRVTIYGNTGSSLKGDDYLVKEISLLYTEFKKMEGHIVQAPNSYLNTLFILNMRRSGGLAEAVPLTVKFGTTLDQIDELRTRLLEYVKTEKREYQPNILTEIRDVVEAYAVNLNVIFFYKSNWQNELLRLQRRNKFICAMMLSMQDIGIEGPRRRIPGSKEDNPFYYQAAGQKLAEGSNGKGGQDQDSEAKIGESRLQSGFLGRDPPFVSNADDPVSRNRPILRSGSGGLKGRSRGESISAMSKRVDFSLGMKDVSSANIMGDLDDHRQTEARFGSSLRSRNAVARIAEDEDEDREAGALKRADSRSSGSRFGMRRSGTGDSTTKRSNSFMHRNRFFSKSKKRDNGSEEEDLMEQGMADMTETEPSGRIGARSGMVSEHPVKPSAESGFSVRRPGTGPAPPASGRTHPSFQERMQLPYADRSQPQDLEMSNMKQ